jgi:hypothetical protein
VLEQVANLSAIQHALVDAEAVSKGVSFEDKAVFAELHPEELPSVIALIVHTKGKLDELHPWWRYFSWALSLSPIGQLLVPGGRYCWWCVLWKYWSFLLLSLGVWKEETYQCLGLPERVFQFVHGSMLGEDFLNSLQAVVATRAILWQIIPPFSILSIYTMNTANSPLVTASIKDFEHFAPNFFFFNFSGSVAESPVSHPHHETVS